jgi:protein CWC15
MSTAARPTYFAAVGRQYGGIRSRHISGKDQNAHTKLKFRQIGQSSTEEMKLKDLKYELETKEELNLIDKKSAISMIENEEKKVDVILLLKNKPDIDPELLKKYDDADINNSGSEDGFDSSSEEEDEDEDDDDDEAELQRELERIKEEKALALAKKEREAAELEEHIAKEAALKGNPLMSLDPSPSSLSAKVKRRWNDDVVFRNQARDEPEHKKRFINDTIRSDFHRSFLKKFIK